MRVSLESVGQVALPDWSPIGRSGATSYVRKAEDVALLLRNPLVDAVEIHTRGG